MNSSMQSIGTLQETRVVGGRGRRSKSLEVGISQAEGVSISKNSNWPKRSLNQYTILNRGSCQRDANRKSVAFKDQPPLSLRTGSSNSCRSGQVEVGEAGHRRKVSTRGARGWFSTEGGSRSTGEDFGFSFEALRLEKHDTCSSPAISARNLDSDTALDDGGYERRRTFSKSLSIFAKREGPKDLFEESDQPCVEKEAHTEFTLSIGEKHHFPADLAMSDEVDRNHEGSSQKHRSDEGHDEVRQEVMPTQRKRRSRRRERFQALGHPHMKTQVDEEERDQHSNVEEPPEPSLDAPAEPDQLTASGQSNEAAEIIITLTTGSLDERRPESPRSKRDSRHHSSSELVMGIDRSLRDADGQHEELESQANNEIGAIRVFAEESGASSSYFSALEALSPDHGELDAQSATEGCLIKKCSHVETNSGVAEIKNCVRLRAETTVENISEASLVGQKSSLNDGRDLRPETELPLRQIEFPTIRGDKSLNPSCTAFNSPAPPQLSKTAASTRSSTSIASLMEKFASRRQHSDSQLPRVLSSEKIGDHPLVSKERRSFKWRSLFLSTPKVSTTTHSSPSFLLDRKSGIEPGATDPCLLGENQLRSITKQSSKSRRERASVHLSPVAEDADRGGSDQLQKKKSSLNPGRSRRSTHARRAESNVVTSPVMQLSAGGSDSSALRPFSMIESSEYDSLMSRRREYFSAAKELTIDKETERKFEAFLRMHAANFAAADRTDDDAFSGVAFLAGSQEERLAMNHSNPCYTGVSTLRRRRGGLPVAASKAPPLAALSPLPPVASRIHKRNRCRPVVKRRQSIHTCVPTKKDVELELEDDQKRTEGNVDNALAGDKQPENGDLHHPEHFPVAIAQKLPLVAKKTEQASKFQPRNPKNDKDRKRDSRAPILGLQNLLSLRQRKRVQPTIITRQHINPHNYDEIKKEGRNLAGVFNPKDVSAAPTTSAAHSECSSRSAKTSIESRTQDLPDVLLNVLGEGRSSREDPTATPIASPEAPVNSSPTNFPFESHSSPPLFYPRPQLVKPKWGDLELWTVECPSWSLKHPDAGNNISANVKKRQNVMHELYTTEKNHWYYSTSGVGMRLKTATNISFSQVIVFLQQAYQVGLRNTGILTAEQLNLLIPDVLDALLDFHLRILRRLRMRLSENLLTESIVDVILDEFESGDYRTAAINAYTSFCLAREESGRAYDTHAERSSSFRRFFDYYEREPDCKGRSFKSCLLLIAQRLTKYPVMMEQLWKLAEPNSPERDASQRALAAVKSFAHRVDTELWKFELARTWDNVRDAIDISSEGRLLGESFSHSDLIAPLIDGRAAASEDGRRLVSIGKVQWQSPTGERVPLRMVLFDDILVLLQNKGPALHFYSQRDHCSVIPLCAILIRDMKRTSEAMLIVLARKSPDMYRLVFANRNEMSQCIAIIDQARQSAPKYVRTEKGCVLVELACRGAANPSEGGDNASTERSYDDDVDEWLSRLSELFAEVNNSENLLREYFERRMEFMDSIREHLGKFPEQPRKFRLSSEGGSSQHSSMTPNKAGRNGRDIERIRELVRVRFDELQQHHKRTIEQAVTRAQKMRDYDLFGLHRELGISDGGTSGPHEGSSPATTTSTSDENGDESPSTSAARVVGKKPTRAKTYHGVGDSGRKSSSSTQSSLRRHTTLPDTEDIGALDENQYEREVEEELAKLPLMSSSKPRKAATEVVRENVALRIENNKLRKENALQDVHIATLRSRKVPVAETADKLEALRQKQEEVQRQEREFQLKAERKTEELSLLSQEIERREMALEMRLRTVNAHNNGLDDISILNINHDDQSVADVSLPDGEVEATLITTAARNRSNGGGGVANENQPPSAFVHVKSRSSSDIMVVPRHLAQKSETKVVDKNKKRGKT